MARDNIIPDYISVLGISYNFFRTTYITLWKKPKKFYHHLFTSNNASHVI